MQLTRSTGGGKSVLNLDGGPETSRVTKRDTNANRGRTACDFRISAVLRDALTSGDVVGGVTESVDAALLVQARILTSFSFGVAEFVVGTLVVRFAFGSRWRDAVTAAVESVTEFYWTHAVAAFVYDETFLEGADAVAALVYFQTFLFETRNTFVVVVEGRVGRAFAFTVGSGDETFVGPTRH